MDRPNLLILHTDQQRWDALGAAGNPDIHTPNLDRLAAEGAIYLRHFVQSPVCMPSRESLLTGTYCSVLGCTENGIPLPTDALTLPRMLKPYGYTSGLVGKLHFLPHAHRDHRYPHPDYGFDHMELSDEPGCYEDAYRAWVRRKAPGELDRISVGLPPATEVWHREMGVRDGIVHPDQRFPKRPIPFAAGADLTHSAFVGEQTVAFLRAHRDRPFFCFSGFYAPHSPWVAPRAFIDLYDPATLALPEMPKEVLARRKEGRFTEEELRLARQGYYAMVSEVDHYVGRILDELDALGLADRTLVVFTSDHGEWLGEHLQYGKGYPGHDQVSRTPLIVRRPDAVGSGVTLERTIVEAVDLLPTLLEAAGVPVPPTCQGRPLPTLPDEAGRDVALTEQTGYKSLRSSRYRYVLRTDGREALYDLETDPNGYRDVAGEPAAAEALSEMRRALAARLVAIERPLPREWAY